MKKKKIVKLVLLILVAIFLFTNIDVVRAVERVNCGNVTGIPKKIPEITSLILKIIQIAVPVILVITGTMDLFKGITAQKEDEMEKGKRILIKRIITAAIIFFVIAIVKFTTSLVANATDNTNISSCMDCFFSFNDSCQGASETPSKDDPTPQDRPTVAERIKRAFSTFKQIGEYIKEYNENNNNGGSSNNNNNNNNNSNNNSVSYAKNIFIGDSKGVLICSAYLVSFSLYPNKHLVLSLVFILAILIHI